MTAKKRTSVKKVKSKTLNIILLGDPGAGKATQATIFAKKYKLLDYDMGRELTLLRQRNSKVEKTLQNTSDKGSLTPTQIVRQLNKKTLLETPVSKGILFDGHPKMLGEAKIVNTLFKKTQRSSPLVMYLKIPQNEIINRVQKRKGYYHTKFSKRPDDTVSALKNRAKYYRKNIAEVIEFYKSVYPYKIIDGMGTRAEVTKRMQKAIDEFLKD